MAVDEIIATIVISIILLVWVFVGVYFFVKYGIEECKHNREIRQQLIKWLKKQNKEE